MRVYFFNILVIKTSVCEMNFISVIHLYLYSDMFNEI